jgi:hypothetical protein
MSAIRYVLLRYRVQLLAASGALIALIVGVRFTDDRASDSSSVNTTLPAAVSIELPTTLKSPSLVPGADVTANPGVPGARSSFKLGAGVSLPMVQASVWRAKAPTTADVLAIGARLGIRGAVSGDTEAGFRLGELMVLGNGTWSYSASGNTACIDASCKAPLAKATVFMSEKEAEQSAFRVFGEEVRISEVTHDQFQTLVFATYVIDSIATDQIGRAGFDADGVLLHASGIVGAFQKIGEYQTLDQATLTEQLLEGSEVRGASPCTQDVRCEINEVKPGLVLVIDGAGTQWFVPGYTMRDTRGGQWVLRAVSVTD